jgi:hypothetical protein
MTTAIGIALLVLVLAAPGIVAVAAIRRLGGFTGFSPTLGEQLFIVASLGLVIDGWLSLVLGSFGVFSATTFGVALASALLAAILGLRLRFADARFSRFVSPRSLGTLAVLVAAAAWLFLAGRPFQWILGGDDAATYVGAGLTMAREGGLVVHDQVVRDVAGMAGTFFYVPDPVRDPMYSRLPYALANVGFFITDPAQGTVVAQGMHMVPSIIALFAAFVGPERALYAVPLIALLGLAGVYHSCRRIFGWPVAAMATVLLFVNFLEQWFARYPTSEMVVQFGLFAGLYFFSLAEELDDRRIAVLAAVLLSWNLLVRVELVLLFVGIGLYVVYRSLSVPAISRLHRWFVVALFPLGVHAFAHLLTVARPYLVYGGSYNMYLERFASEEKLFAASMISMGILAVTFLLLTWFAFRHWSAIQRRLGPSAMRMGRPFAVTLAVAIALALLYAYFLRPGIVPVVNGPDSPQHPDGYSLVKLGWYLSLPGLALAGAGAVALVLFGAPRTRFLLLVALPFGLFYINNPLGFSLQPQWARRLVYVVLPFACICEAYLIGLTAGFVARRARVAGAALAVVSTLALAGISGRMSLPFVRYVEHAGSFDLIGRLSDKMPARDSVLLLPVSPIGFYLGVPLRYVAGRQTLLVGQHFDPATLQCAVARWQDAGRTAYWVAPSSGARRSDGIAAVADMNESLPVTERPAERPPSAVLPLRLNLSAFEVSDETARSFRVTPGDEAPGRLWGAYDDIVHRSDGRPMRWLMPQARIALCRPPGTTGRLKLRFAAARPREAPMAAVQIVIDGHESARRSIQDDATDMEFDVDLGAPGPVVVHIESTTWIPDLFTGNGDRREFGAGFLGAEVRRLP